VWECESVGVGGVVRESGTCSLSICTLTLSVLTTRMVRVSILITAAGDRVDTYRNVSEISVPLMMELWVPQSAN
jgi:hypothetical protein